MGPNRIERICCGRPEEYSWLITNNVWPWGQGLVLPMTPGLCFAHSTYSVWVSSSVNEWMNWWMDEWMNKYLAVIGWPDGWLWEKSLIGHNFCSSFSCCLCTACFPFFPTFVSAQAFRCPQGALLAVQDPMWPPFLWVVPTLSLSLPHSPETFQFWVSFRGCSFSCLSPMG